MKKLLQVVLATLIVMLSLVPSILQAQDTEAEKLYEKGKTEINDDLAINYLTQAISYDNPKSKYFYERGRHYYKKKEYQTAILDFDRSISIDEQVNYLFDRALTYMELHDLNMGNNLYAENAYADLQKIKTRNSNYNSEKVDEYIKELRPYIRIIEVDHEYLGNRLYRFHLKNSQTLYIRLPEKLTSATFNIVKQDPIKEGPGSGQFLLKQATKDGFINNFVTKIDLIQREKMICIISIDTPERIGLQEELTYGPDSINMNTPSYHYAWFEGYPPVENAKAWLEFKDKSSGVIDGLPENWVAHNGKLRVRVLDGSTPVRIIGHSITCSMYKDSAEAYYNAVLEKVFEVSDCTLFFINLMIDLPDGVRWLLERPAGEDMMMQNLHLEINGKLFPNDLKYVDQKRDCCANFMVNLKRLDK